MEEEDSEVMGGSEGGGCRGGDDAASKNNTPMGSNNNRAQQRGRRAEHFFPDAPQSLALLPQCVNRRGGDAAAREDNLLAGTRKRGGRGPSGAARNAFPRLGGTKCAREEMGVTVRRVIVKIEVTINW